MRGRCARVGACGSSVAPGASQVDVSSPPLPLPRVPQGCARVPPAFDGNTGELMQGRRSGCYSFPPPSSSLALARWFWLWRSLTCDNSFSSEGALAIALRASSQFACLGWASARRAAEASRAFSERALAPVLRACSQSACLGWGSARTAAGASQARRRRRWRRRAGSHVAVAARSLGAGAPPARRGERGGMPCADGLLRHPRRWLCQLGGCF